MNKKLLSLFSLKFDPFSQDVPAAALWISPALQSFTWRIEQQVVQGGFALVVGEPGSGKSVALRLLADHCTQKPDLLVGVLTRPQASLADFYRELGHLFGVPLSPSNRWNSAQVLREKWHAHLEGSVFRPLLLVDEAQEMRDSVFAELRLLTSTELDSRSLLTVVLAGDQRLAARLETPDLLPIASRIRCRLRAESLTPPQLRECLLHRLATAGNAKLLPTSLIQTLCDHAAGNLRLLMNLGNDLLSGAIQREREVIDEKLYFEVFSVDPKPGKRSSTLSPS